MRTVGAAVAIAALIGLSGCFGFGAKPVDAAHTTIDKGFFSGYDADGFEGLALDNRTEWAVFWEEHEKNRHPKSDPPIVDFDTRFVVAVLMGDKPTGGYTVNITGIQAKGDTYTVSYAETEPGEGENVTQTETSPYHIVSVERVGDGEPRLEFNPA